MRPPALAVSILVLPFLPSSVFLLLLVSRTMATAFGSKHTTTTLFVLREEENEAKKMTAIQTTAQKNDRAAHL
uniref:Secreted protein n=1 Tax=Caenorhabditis tropicalis TaxID=1561998 RepID=A0A1I7UAN7_9PELO